jgi:hypothetical protein
MILMTPLAARFAARPDTLAHSAADLDALAEDLGYIRLSGTAKSRVYTDPARITAVKIAFGDDAYYRFSAYARDRIDDPHMPRFASALRQDSGTAIYELEYLGPAVLPDSYRSFIVVKDIGHFADGETRREAEDFRALHPEFSASLDRLYRDRPCWCLSDLWARNIRMRGQTPVIIDPWS